MSFSWIERCQGSAVDREDLGLDLAGDLEPGSLPRGVGQFVLVFGVERLDLILRRLGDIGEEARDRIGRGLDRNALVLIAVRGEDVERRNDRRTGQLPDPVQAELVGDVTKDLLAADLVGLAAERPLEQLARHLVAGHLLEPLFGHLGTGGHLECVGLVLEDQGIDERPGRGDIAEDGRAGDAVKDRRELGQEPIGPVPLGGHRVDVAGVDRLAVEGDHDGIAIGAHVAPAQEPGERVGQHKAEHGQDREDGEKLPLMASKHRERHGVPQGSKDRPPGSGPRPPPLTRPDTLSYLKGAGRDDRPNA